MADTPGGTAERMRREKESKLARLREEGIDPYPYRYERTATAAQCHAQGEAWIAEGRELALAGRLMSQRVMGKTSFGHLEDRSGRLQLFLRKDDMDADSYARFVKLVETGDILNAEESYKEGLIDVLVDEGKALEAALEYARKLARGPSVAVDLARRFVHKALVSTLDEMLDYEAVAATMSAHTEDAREGTKAFVEKRKPEFKGR